MKCDQIKAKRLSDFDKNKSKQVMPKMFRQQVFLAVPGSLK